MKYEFSLEFKTLARDGIMFYVADDRHIDYIALYMKDGQVGDSFAKM
jgi:laminin alpha 3/5